MIATVAFLVAFVGAQTQTNDSPQHDTSSSLKIASNLVVVRVVVRDKQGKPVENLTKEDFKLFDRGKEQSISQFEAESSPVLPSPSIKVGAPEHPSPTRPTSSRKFIAFYFDDLNTSDGDMIQARDAADQYLAAHIQTLDGVAIFTSEQMLSDFTSDPREIHDALFKLHASGRALAEHHCPDLSDYQALRITENDALALSVAIDEALHCDMGSLEKAPRDFLEILIRKLAQNVVNQSQMQTRANLEGLKQAVTSLSQQSGERTLILVSPGFLSVHEENRVDELIDQALRAQIVVNALDAKGLAILMRSVDASRSYIPALRPDLLRDASRLDSEREGVATGVLANLTGSTGGLFFSNDNDLRAGFSLLAGTPAYYILAFAPKDIKTDGKFHPLKVVLTKKERGFKVQARRGYFPQNPDEDLQHFVNN